MKRITIVVAALVLAAAAFAAWGTAAPGGKVAALAGPTANPKPAKPKLPALPSDVKKRKKWLIGVKCDFSPFGFIDVRGNNDGYDVQVARRFATLAFGSNKKIDFTIPYYSATGRLLVPNSSSLNVGNLGGKTIVTTRGAIYATWTSNCFKNSTLLQVDSPALAVAAVKDGRADTFMFDDAFLLGVATQDRDLRLTGDKFLNVPWGIGIRKGDTAMSRWVNAALRYMKKKDEFVKILKANAPARLVPDFLDNVPRPKNTFAYPVGKDVASICP